MRKLLYSSVSSAHGEIPTQNTRAMDIILPYDIAPVFYVAFPLQLSILTLPASSALLHGFAHHDSICKVQVPVSM